MVIASHPIGVCSWSLRPTDLADLAAQVRALNLEHVQLALAPLLGLDESALQQQLSHLRSAALTITAGMIAFEGEDYSSIAIIQETGGLAPNPFWPQRRELITAAAALSANMGLNILTMHVGFVPPSNHATYGTMVQRVTEVAAILGAKGISLGMETGQESAGELLQFINDLALRNVLVNFDPANMVLYGAGDPIEAIKILGRHIGHVHVKDGTLSAQPGILWGEEVPFGTGLVNPTAFLNALAAVGYRGPLCIEREAGNTRLDDVRQAINALTREAK